MQAVICMYPRLEELCLALSGEVASTINCIDNHAWIHRQGRTSDELDIKVIALHEYIK